MCIPTSKRVYGGGGFRFSDGCQSFPPKTFCATRAISCSLRRQLTFFFCREVLVPVYCMSGSVFMLVRVPIFFFLCILRIPKNDFLCT